MPEARADNRPSETDPLTARLAAACAAEPGTVDEIRARHRARVLERFETAKARVEGAEDFAALTSFSDATLSALNAEINSDPYARGFKALRYGWSVYRVVRQIQERLPEHGGLTDAEGEVWWRVKKLLAEDPVLKPFTACGAVAKQLGKAHRTVWNQYRAADGKVEKIKAVFAA